MSKQGFVDEAVGKATGHIIAIIASELKEKPILEIAHMIEDVLIDMLQDVCEEAERNG